MDLPDGGHARPRPSGRATPRRPTRIRAAQKSPINANKALAVQIASARNGCSRWLGRNWKHLLASQAVPPGPGPHLCQTTTPSTRKPNAATTAATGQARLSNRCRRVKAGFSTPVLSKRNRRSASARWPPSASRSSRPELRAAWGASTRSSARLGQGRSRSRLRSSPWR